MTRYLVLALALVATPAAADCPVKHAPKGNYLDEIVKAMKGTSCAEAEQLAAQCAMGSSGDTQIAGTATAICQKDFASNKDDKALFSKLSKRCAAKYAKSEGTMYMSMAAFCELDVAKLLSMLNRSPD